GEDGAREYVGEGAARWPIFGVRKNRRNVGKSRGMLQLQEALTDGLAVMFDSDIELLSNYWLVHLQKAYHAARLRFGNTDVAFGLRPLNCEEYGFGFTYDQEVLPIPHQANDLPRPSYAAVSKDSPATDHPLADHP